MEKCIQSVLAGGEDVEVIIVDDGSTKDETAKIADEYAAKYPTIVKAVHQENGGHGQAVNTGLAHATGKYFKVVDSDDWVDLKSYRRVLATLKKFDEAEEPDMVIANYVYEKVGAKRKKVIHYDNVFPEETLFFALTTKRNSGARYIPDLYDRGVRNFVITEEDFKEVENGELRVKNKE